MNNVKFLSIYTPMYLQSLSFKGVNAYKRFYFVKSVLQAMLYVTMSDLMALIEKVDRKVSRNFSSCDSRF